MNGSLVVALALIFGLMMLLIAVVAGVRIATAQAAREGRSSK